MTDRNAPGYYDQPLLKPAVWTWEVPAYFFVGGLAGIAALIGAAGLLTGAPAALVRDAHLVAVAGALLSPPLLISDLGRPARFLNMLRVFKITSPMSIGAWTLAVFTPAAIVALGLDFYATADRGAIHVGALAVANGVASITGLLLATYTGVLIGATALPIWSRHAAILPLHFAASSLGAAASTIELLGHQEQALHVMALAAALAESVIAVALRLRGAGATGLAIRAGEVGSGFIPLIARTVLVNVPGARAVAGVAAIAGALLTRIGWIAAGKAPAFR